MQTKTEQPFNFNLLFQGALSNEPRQTTWLIMHILQRQLTDEQIVSIINSTKQAEQEPNNESLATLWVLNALLHQEGLGGEVDFAAAADLLDRALQYNNPFAYARRALLYFKQQNGQYYAQAIDLLKKGIEYHDSTAMNALGLIYDKLGREQEANELLLQSADLENSSSMNHVAWFYYSGRLSENKKPDLLSTLEYFNGSIALGNRAAMLNLAFLLHEEDSGFKRDELTASHLYRMAHAIKPLGQKSRQRLDSLYQEETRNRQIKYQILMTKNNAESQLLHLYQEAPSTTLVMLLKDKLLSTHQQYHYLKAIIRFCEANNTSVINELERDNCSVDRAQAANLLGKFCTETALHVLREEDQIDALLLELLEQVPSDSSYYQTALIIKCDNWFNYFCHNTLDCGYPRSLLMAQILATHQIILSRDLRILQATLDLKKGFDGTPTDPVIANTISNIKLVLKHKKEFYKLAIGKQYSAALSQEDKHVAIYAARVEFMQKIEPDITHYFQKAYEVLKEIQAKISDEYPTKSFLNRGFRRNQRLPVLELMDSIIQELPEKYLSNLQVVGAVIKIYQLASSHFCPANPKDSKNRFYMDILTKIETINTKALSKQDLRNYQGRCNAL